MSVGYKLYRQIRDHAPQNWTSGELVVAWIIADDANDDTRRSFIPASELRYRTRLTESGIRKALAKLAERGFEFRVSKGKGKDGREVYATRGNPPEYMVPDIFQLLVRGAAVAFSLVDNPPEGGTSVPPWMGLSTAQGGTVVQRRRDAGPAFRGAYLFLAFLSTYLNQLRSICPHTCTWKAPELSTGARRIEMETENDGSKFGTWAIAELIGHRRVAGYASEKERHDHHLRRQRRPR